MCKLVIMGGIRPKYRDNAEKFVAAIAPIMSEKDTDGLGYASFDPDGNLNGERWHINKEAFKNRDKFNDIDKLIIKEFRNTLIKDEKYNSFGDIDKPISAIILHARMATSGKEFQNTHPFVDSGTALIHNGVIYNDTTLTKKHSTCDSEVILHEYLKEKVNKDIKNFDKVAKTLSGYYALGILSKTKDGLPILDVVKDKKASLYAVHVLELGAIVFATDPTHVYKACKSKKLNFTISSSFQIKDNVIIRMNALTGHVIETATFDDTVDYTSEGYRSRWQSQYNKLEECSYIEGVLTRQSNEESVVPSLPRTHEFSPLNVGSLSSINDWEYCEETKTYKKVGG
jgi:predicted glutamine amidotransferase